MNNKILVIQEMLMRQMRRLDDDNEMATNGKNEVARSNALSQDAMTFIKTVNLGLRIKEVAEKQGQTVEALNSELGINDEKKI